MKTPSNDLSYIPESIIDQAAAINDTLNQIDPVLQAEVEAILNAPPASPLHGACYFVGATPTGAFSGNKGKLAQFFEDHWNFRKVSYFKNKADSLFYIVVDDEAISQISFAASEFGRNFVQASNAAAARNSLELGTAATANVTTSSTDTTAGRLMKVGDGGLLAVGNTLATTDLDNPATFTHLVQRGYASLNFWPNSTAGFALNFYYSERFAAQIATSLRGDRWAVRGKDYTWNAWKELAFLDSPAFTGTPSVPNLKFGNVASADVNTLDYYEEGTWTPTVEPTTTPGAIVYTSRVGAYTKIGDLVFWSAQISLAALGGAAGEFRIGGLPFIVRAGVAHSGGVSVGYFSSLSTTNIVNVFGMHGVSTSFVILRKIHATGGATAAVLLMSDVSDNFQIRLSGVYKAA